MREAREIWRDESEFVNADKRNEGYSQFNERLTQISIAYNMDFH